MDDPRLGLVASLIRNIPDFPKSGIQFKDITPLIGDAEVFAHSIDLLAEATPEGVAAICGVESRGFIFGAPLAAKLGLGFVPIRKPGKLPGSVIEESFDLEYGSSTLAIHEDALAPGAEVLLIDDLLATGGTLGASVKLIRRLGATVKQIQVVVELDGLGGREALLDIGIKEVLALFHVAG